MIWIPSVAYTLYNKAIVFQQSFTLLKIKDMQVMP